MKLPFYYVLACAILLADQLLKLWMLHLLPLCRPYACQSIEILPFFKLTLLHNYGAAFSFLHDAGGWQRWLLSAFSAGVSVFIIVWLARVHRQPLLALALALILGGALGNLADRLHYGYVVDFIVLHYAGWHFPAFNLADAAITAGAALLILDMLLAPRGAR